MRKATKLGFVSGFLIAGCSTAPPRTDKGAFKVEDVVQTTDDAIRVQVNHREVPLQEMPMASLLAGLPMAGLADVVIDLTVPGEGGRFRIVVSGGAVESGMLEGLLAHEMSHIVRMRTRHPSHNPRIIEAAIRQVGDGVATTDYQRKILHDLVNNVEDLYADDIAFEVIRKVGLMTAKEATEFLQNWVEDAPSEARDRTRARWENAWRLANNARAIAQMERHGVEDTGGVAAAASDRLLSRMGPAARGPFEYLRNLLVNLKKGITEDEYRKLLVDYLGRFLEVAERT